MLNENLLNESLLLMDFFNENLRINSVSINDTKKLTEIVKSEKAKKLIEKQKKKGYNVVRSQEDIPYEVRKKFNYQVNYGEDVKFKKINGMLCLIKFLEYRKNDIFEISLMFYSKEYEYIKVRRIFKSLTAVSK